MSHGCNPKKTKKKKKKEKETKKNDRDRGKKEIKTTSEGGNRENKKIIEKKKKKIKGLNKWLSRTRPASKNRYKVKQKLQRVYQKLSQSSCCGTVETNPN